MNYKLDNAYYFDYLNVIGGVESHLYYLTKKYSDRNWAILANHGDINQIVRLSKNVPVIILKPGDTVECNRIFLTYDLSILDRVTAKEKIFVCHANYEAQVSQGTMPRNAITNVINEPRIDKVIAVSKTASSGFEGAEVVYMPLDLDTYEEPILLVSATRLTAEKGLHRMRALAKMLDDAKVNYLWHVYTNSNQEIESPNVQFMKPRLDIVSKLPLYDALVQLSDSEAFCISMQEALLSGLPLISTDLQLLKEDFHLDDRSVITFPFDMEESGQIEKIRHIKKMKSDMPKYKMPPEKWGELLTGTMNKEIKEKYQMKIYRVKANSVSFERGIILMELGRPALPEEEFNTTEDRIDNLVNGNNKFRVPFAEIVEELKAQGPMGPVGIEDEPAEKPIEKPKKTRKKKAE